MSQVVLLGKQQADDEKQKTYWPGDASKKVQLCFRCVSLRFVSFRFVSFRFVSSRLVSSRFVSFRFVSFRFVSASLATSSSLGGTTCTSGGNVRTFQTSASFDPYVRITYVRNETFGVPPRVRCSACDSAFRPGFRCSACDSAFGPGFGCSARGSDVYSA